MNLGVIAQRFGLPLRESIDASASAGVDGVQLYAASPRERLVDFSAAERREVREYCAGAGLEIFSICGEVGGFGFREADKNPAKIEYTKRNIDLALELGCDIAFNPKDCDAVAYVKELTEGRGADVVFDTTTPPAVAAQAIDMAGKLGRVVMYSSVIPADPIPFDANALHSSEKIITGSVSPSIQSFDTAVRLLNKGLINPKKLLHSVFEKEDAVQAFETSIRPDTYRVIIKL